MAGELLAAAPAAPLVFGAGELVILCAWLFLFLLLYTYRYTLGALILQLAAMVDDIWLVGDDLAAALEKLDHIIMKAIATGLAGLEEAAAQTWSAITWTIRATGDAIVAVAESGQATAEAIVGAIIPEQVEARTGPLAGRIDRTNTELDARWRAEAQARGRGIDRLDRDLAAEQRARQRGIDAVNWRIDRVVLPQVRGLGRELDALRGWARGALDRRVGALERALAAGALGAVAIAALTRVFPYWQCTNVRRFNRMVCRSPIGALDDLLGLALAVVGAMSILELARACQAVTGFTADAIGDFVVED